MLVDSNIIIYASLREHADLRKFIAAHAPAVSAVSYVEVLGYHALTAEEEAGFRQFFAVSTLLPVDQDVLDQAVVLRRRYRMSLGDALVAATALVHHLALVTHNVDDFCRIEGLTVIDPLRRAP
ncbi:MAG TPA: type II toxin-antitoxin system VapC family toxin [Anaerolineae bacterium]|nr:type II toxin-antitoxin system VapC family toxin [Anaerolineae bacterium]